MTTLLNWGKGRTCVGQHSHWGEMAPCRVCKRYTPIKDCDGQPCHKVCAEAEL